MALKELKVKVGLDLSGYDAGLKQMTAREEAAAARTSQIRTEAARRGASLERSAAYDVAAVHAQLTQKRWAAERSAARAEHAKEIADLQELAAKGEEIKQRTRLADLKHAERMKQIELERVQTSSDKARNAGIGMTVGVTAPLTLFGKEALDAGIRMDSLERGLTAVMGSSAAARGELVRLREVAKLPGLGFKEAIEGSINLQSAGMSAKQARESLMAFGNALATVGKGKDALDGVNIALVQLMNRTSGFGQEIRQLQNWLPQIRQMMIKAFGTADSEAIGKSGITGAQFVEAITKEFAKLPKMTGGVQNAFENMSDGMNVAMSKMEKAVEPVVIKIANKITDVANAFSSWSPAAQQATVYALAATAAAGPLLTVSSQVANILVARQIKSMAAAAASSTDTVATVANTAAVTANTAAQGSNATALAADTAAIEANTAAKGANAAATGGMVKALAFLKNGLGLLAAGYAGAELLDATFGNIDRWLLRKAGLNGIADNLNFSPTRTIKEGMDMAEARRQAAAARENTAAGTVSARDYIKGGTHSIRKAEEERAARAAANDPAKQALAAEDEEQKKLLAAHEEANKRAQQDIYIRNHATEIEREKARAWVEYKNAVAEVHAKDKEILDASGKMVDSSVQLKGLKLQYTQALQDIQAKERETLLDQKNAQGVAQLQLAALQSTNEYDQERLQVHAEYLRTGRELVKQKASEVEVKLAYAQAMKQLADIDKKQAQDQAKRSDALAAAKADDQFAAAEAEAIKSGNKALQEQIAAYREKWDAYKDLAALAAKGLSYTGQKQKADAVYDSKIAEIRKEAEERKKQKADAAADAAFGTWKDSMGTYADAVESYWAMQGDPDRGKREALAARHNANAGEIERLRSKAQTPGEKYNAEIMGYAEQVSYAKQLKDLEDERAQTVLARVEADRKANQEALQAARDRQKAYMDERQSRVGFIGLQEYAEQGIASGFKTRWSDRMSRYSQPGSDNSPVSKSEVDRIVAAIRQSADMTARALSQVGGYLRPSYGEAR